MAPKTMLPGAALLLLRLLLLLLLQADPLHGAPPPVRTAVQADPRRHAMSLRLLDAFTRQPRQIRFKSSYLELPAVLRELVGFQGLDHLSYFVQVDVPDAPPASTALDRLPAGTKTYFPPYVSLLGTPTTDKTTAEDPKQNSVVSKTLGSSQVLGKQSGLGGIKNVSEVSDNKLDIPLSNSLGTDGGPSANPTLFSYSNSSSASSNLAGQTQNDSYSSSEIPWLPQIYNFLRSSPLGASSSAPNTIKVASTSTPITTHSLTTTNTAAPQTVTTTTTATISSPPLSSPTTPLPLTRYTPSFPQPAGSTHITRNNSTSSNFPLLETHATFNTKPSQILLPPLPTSQSTKPTTSSVSTSQLPAKHPYQIKSNSTASSFPFIKKHSSNLKSFTLPSTSSLSSKSLTFPSRPSYSSLRSRAPSSKTSPSSIQSAAQSPTNIQSKHALKYAKFTTTSSAAKSVKVLMPPSTSLTKFGSLRASRPRQRTSFPRVNQSDSSSKAASGTNLDSHQTRRPAARPSKTLASSASTTSSPFHTQGSHRTTTLATRPSKSFSPSRSSRLLSSTNNFFSKTSRPSNALPNGFASRVLAQMRARPSKSSLPSFRNTAASSSPLTSPTQLRPTTPGTNPKTFSSTSLQVLQSPRGWKRGKTVEMGRKVKSKVGGRLREDEDDTRGGGGGGRGGKGAGGERSRTGKARKKILGDIIQDRKALLGRIKGGSKGVSSIGMLSRLDKLQVRGKLGKGNRGVADRQDLALPALRTTLTPKPEGRTRPPDGRTHDDATVPKPDFPTLSSIPRTAFVCPDTPEGGYFADTEAGCQVFHVCWDNRRATFLCPQGTLFNQRVQVCDWRYNVDCGAKLAGDTSTRVT